MISSLVSQASRLADINQREPTMKQFKDMNQAERDQFAIKRMMERKAKAESKGKTYKPRMTGDMPRLIKEYPSQFTWMTSNNVITQSVDHAELLKVQHSLDTANQMVKHQQGLLSSQGDTIKQLKNKDVKVNKYRGAGIEDLLHTIKSLEHSSEQQAKRHQREIEKLKLNEEKRIRVFKYMRELERQLGISPLEKDFSKD